MSRLFIQRHAEYQSGFPALGWGKPTAEEQKTLGHLTTEGIEQTKVLASLRLSELEVTNATRFVFVASPTYWLDDPKLGQRAVETARIIERFVSVSYQTEFRTDCRLCEAQMYDTQYPNFLREQGGNLWDDYLTDKYEEERYVFGAEGPLSVALRVDSVITDMSQMLVRAGNSNLVVWVVTHGECLDAYLRHIKEMKDIPYMNHNDGLFL